MADFKGMAILRVYDSYTADQTIDNLSILYPQKILDGIPVFN